MPGRPFLLLIGRRLRAARVSLGFGKRQFAEELGLSQETYERIEEGHQEPGLDTLVYAAKVTGKSVDFLLTGRSFDEAA